MKTTILTIVFLLTLSLICIPQPSHAQEGLRLPQEEQLYDSVVSFGLSALSLNTIRTDLCITRHAIQKTFTKLPSSDKGQLEIAAKTMPLKTVSDAVFQAKLICEYEAQLLTILFYIREGDKEHVYHVRRRALQFSKRSLADCLSRIEEDSNHIDNTVALRLIDKAKKEIRSDLQRIQSTIEIIGHLEEYSDSQNK